jgi:hypothetical protein
MGNIFIFVLAGHEVCRFHRRKFDPALMTSRHTDICNDDVFYFHDARLVPGRTGEGL